MNVLNDSKLETITGGRSKNDCVWGVMAAAGGAFVAGVGVSGPLAVFGGAMAGAGAAVALCK